MQTLGNRKLGAFALLLFVSLGHELRGQFDMSNLQPPDAVEEAIVFQRHLSSLPCQSTSKDLITGTDGGGRILLLSWEDGSRWVKATIYLSTEVAIWSYLFNEERLVLATKHRRRSGMRSSSASELSAPNLVAEENYYFDGSSLVFSTSARVAAEGVLERESQLVSGESLLREASFFRAAAESDSSPVDIESFLKSAE
jgi:hypothetical protein